MATQERLKARGQRKARRVLAELAVEIRQARLTGGLSQVELGRRAGVSGDKVWKLEHERLATLSITEACVIGAVVGLDLSVRAYPNGAPIRDAGQAPRLMKLLGEVRPPLSYGVDVPLPRREDAPELRAWDAIIEGLDERTGVEQESRITDVQSTLRRHNLKRADDPVEHFLLVVADTKHNRRVMREFSALFGDLPRLRAATVLDRVRSGQHPPTGWMFL